jgi:hypothetical protein
MTGCGLPVNIVLKSTSYVLFFFFALFARAVFADRVVFWVQGFLHGAWYEGRDAGQELAECIKGGGCASVRQHFEDVTNARPYAVDQYNDRRRK